MRKVIFPLAFIAGSSLIACSFQVGSGRGNQPQNPQNAQSAQPQQPAAQPTAAKPPPPPSGPARRVGKRTTGPVGPTPTPSTTPSGSSSTAPAPAPTPTIPAGVPVVNAQTIFGNGTAPVPPAVAWKGTLYWLAAGTTKLPDFTTAKASGFLFTSELNVTAQAFSTGFPGVDAAKKENFAIRYEAPLTVTGETQDWDFRLVSDDGAVLSIDGLKIVENDGVKTAPAEKSGPVRLTAAQHLITVDYFQTTGPVALQVYCKKVGETADKICPLSLQ